MSSQTAAVETYPVLLRAHSVLNRELDARLLTRHNLTLMDYEVLYHLWRAPDNKMRRVDICRKVLLTQSGMTRLLKGLEDEGLVERLSCGEDARVFFAQLTDRGMKEFPAMRRRHLKDIDELFGCYFSTSELGDLQELLGRICPASVGAKSK